MVQDERDLDQFAVGYPPDGPPWLTSAITSRLTRHKRRVLACCALSTTAGACRVEGSPLCCVVASGNGFGTHVPRSRAPIWRLVTVAPQLIHGRTCAMQLGTPSTAGMGPAHCSDDVATGDGDEADGSRNKGPQPDGRDRRSHAYGIVNSGDDVGEGVRYPRCGFADRLYG